ncbi:hypothetical protein AC578_1164 [Pseudocercospora eumusae]|uniref:NADH:flavin oxidoreductase/NADH oxidase N-terminal domain-containing protein n=1 Tax=Pseudocercospora eumusae TaxID=321146 RepID=A0A139HJH9_9PEZI|nr:hypothetical protein AC578_1164 [Pseudocercospora eumusae]
MEYDKAVTPGSLEAKAYPPLSQSVGGQDGKLRVDGPKVDVNVLKESITFPFSGRTAKNRFLKTPMTERLCKWNAEGEDISARGFPTQEYEHLYETSGKGEIGVIVAGNVMLKYDVVEAFKRVSEKAKANGSLFIAQLSHPGRQGSAALNPNPISASDVQLKIKWAGNWFAQPRALTIPEIKDLVKHWGEVAHLCYQAGMDGVQIHCAHGYLLAQFLSNTTNLRTAAPREPKPNHLRDHRRKSTTESPTPNSSYASSSTA